jgi:hypothetical protein
MAYNILSYFGMYFGLKEGNSMWESKLIELLSRFTAGELSISEFHDTIDERLFELRISPPLSPEKELLSKIQLYLHEIDEGLRDKFEIYILALSILEQYLTLLPRRAETKSYSLTPLAPQTTSWDAYEPEMSKYEKIQVTV